MTDVVLSINPDPPPAPRESLGRSLQRLDLGARKLRQVRMSSFIYGRILRIFRRQPSKRRHIKDRFFVRDRLQWNVTIYNWSRAYPTRSCPKIFTFVPAKTKTKHYCGCHMDTGEMHTQGLDFPFSDIVCI